MPVDCSSLEVVMLRAENDLDDAAKDWWITSAANTAMTGAFLASTAAIIYGSGGLFLLVGGASALGTLNAIGEQVDADEDYRDVERDYEAARDAYCACVFSNTGN